MARQDPWARADADWTPREEPPDEGQHAPTAPRNAPSARRHRKQPAEQAGLGRGYSCGASRLRPWLLDRTSALLALWTCRRRAMLNRLARDATGMKLLPTTHHRGRCMYDRIVCARVCPSPWPSRSLPLNGRLRPGPRHSFLPSRVRPLLTP